MFIQKNALAIFVLTAILISPVMESFAFSNGQPASNVIGQPDFTTVTSGGGNNKISGTTDVALDSAGNLWVADYQNSRILKFNGPTFIDGQAASIVIGQPDFVTVSTGTANNKLNAPGSIAFDSSGTLWVSDAGNNRVLKFASPLSTGMAATVVIGQTDFVSSSSGSGNSKFFTPFGITFDSAGSLLVADLNNNRVLKFAAPLSTGMAATAVIGQPDFATTSSGSGNSKFSTPHDVAYDSAGSLLVADLNNNRVLKFAAPLSTGMAATVVIGQTDFATTSSGSGNSKFTLPGGIALDSAGNLLVSDGRNNRVLKFAAPLATGMAATTVIGQPDFATTSSGSGNSKLNNPYGVALDSAGSLWVADYNNYRVLKFASITSGAQVTSSVNVAGTCGLSIVSGSPINYGTLVPGATSTEQPLVLDNTGSVPAILQVKASHWLDGTSTNKMNVDNTKFSTSSGAYASKTSLLTTSQTITGAFLPTPNLSTYWQLQVNLLDSSFSGSLTQTMDFTTTC